MTIIRNTLWSLTAIFCLGLGASGCLLSKAPSEPALDSETHFLKACDDDCDEGLSCICGVCSAVCDPALDCSGRHPDASCVPLEAFGGDQCSARGVQTVCELECQADADCETLSDDHTCRDGRCRAPMTPPPGDGCLYQGETYDAGERFDAADGCNTCMCDDDGNVACTERACLPDDFCEYDGARYEPGETFPSPDGCNTCSCSEGGQVACTLRACVPADCADLDADACAASNRCAPITGRRYNEAEVCIEGRQALGCHPADTGCGDAETYAEGPDGNTYWFPSTCVPPGFTEVPYPNDTTGEPCASGDGCVYEGTRYAPGDTFDAADGCNTCSCSADGLVACTERACVPDACEKLDADLCMRRDDCTPITGQRIDGQRMCLEPRVPVGCRPADTSCGEAISYGMAPGGDLYRFRNTCVPVDFGPARPQNPPNSSCDTAEVCRYDGVGYPAGASFPATDGCNTCSCSDSGAVACTRRACVDTCDYNGQTYNVGDSFPSDDGCNTCACTTGGQIACTLRACAPTGCDYAGNNYPLRSTFRDPQGCGECTCQPDGSVACTDVACLCTEGGKRYAAGETYPAGDGCNTCTCQADGNGNAAPICTLRACPQPVTPECTSDFDPGICQAAFPVYWFNPQSQQCEQRVWGGCGGNGNRYDTLLECNQGCGIISTQVGCEVNGKVYDSGTAVPDPYSCNTCTCVNGQLTACTEIACDTPCPPNAVQGTTCGQCGLAGGCAYIETGCLPVCSDDASCQADGYFRCDTQKNHCVIDGCI